MNLGAWGCPNCEGDEGPAVEVLAGVPAFGGENQSKSLFQAGALTAHGARNDFASETFCVAPTLAGGARKAGGYSCDDIPLTAATLDASYGRLQGCSGQDLNHGHSHLIAVHGTQDPDCLVNQAHTLGRNHGQENAVFAIQAGALRTNPTSGPDGVGVQADHAYTLEARAEVQAVAFTQNSRSEVRKIGGDGQVVGALAADHGVQQQNYLAAGPAVRRLTPRECERLQGFPDDYTLIPWRGKPAEECPDGPRYKAIGNSKAIPVVRWIGRRLMHQLEA